MGPASGPGNNKTHNDEAVLCVWTSPQLLVKYHACPTHTYIKLNISNNASRSLNHAAPNITQEETTTHQMRQSMYYTPYAVQMCPIIANMGQRTKAYTGDNNECDQFNS